MMSSDLVNDLFIPDEEKAIDIFRSIRWPNGVYCPKCKSFEVYKRGKRGRIHRYSCKSCGSNFNDFSDTIFNKSKVPMGEMLYILFNLDNKSIKQMSEELTSSRQAIHRIAKLFRESVFKKHTNPNLEDEIEIDEMYISSGSKGIKKTFLGKED